MSNADVFRVSFLVTDQKGRPMPAGALDRQLDEIHELLLARAPKNISDIDVSAALARGEVSFTMLVEGIKDEAAVLVAALNLIIPAIATVGGEPRLGPLLRQVASLERRTTTKGRGASRPRYELVSV